MTQEREIVIPATNHSKSSLKIEPQKKVNESVSRPFVYAIGRIEARFPSIAIEKEFAQVTGLSSTAGLSDRQVQHSVLSQRENYYLVRKMCWVLKIEGIETYILQPRCAGDVGPLVDALRPTPRPTDVNVQ